MAGRCGLWVQICCDTLLNKMSYYTCLCYCKVGSLEAAKDSIMI